MNILGVKARNITKVLMNRPSCRFFTLSSRCMKNTSLREPPKEGDALGVKYTQSGAAKWKSFDTFTLPEDRTRARPKAEPFVVSISVGIFLAYFLWFREENDVDLEIDKPLYERLPSLERAQLRAQIRHNERDGLDSDQLKIRLQQVNREIKRRQEQQD